MSKQCKCEHWQQCPVCMPHRFDSNGNPLPPEPTPLQATRNRIEELERENNRLKEAMNKYSEDEILCSLQADNARLRSYLTRILEYWTQDGNNQELFDMLCHIEETVKAALAATPAQSLARIRNQVRDECALEADRQFEDEPYGHAKFRCANIALEIRAMKEPQ